MRGVEACAGGGALGGGRGGGGMVAPEVEAIVVRLFEVDAVKFGDFKLKSGIMSPFYLDLRVMVSYPDILAGVAEAMWGKLEAGGALGRVDIMCGVPYTALPIATAMTLAHREVPMLMRRKEVKEYGTKKAIEGHYAAGQNCLIVEDLVTSGMSVMETVAPLEAEGLKVTDVVVAVDREQGGKANLEAKGLHLHAVCTITEIIEILVRRGKISKVMAQRVREFVADNQVTGSNAAEVSAKMKDNDNAMKDNDAGLRVTNLPFGARAAQCVNPAARRLLEICEAKRTNLCVAADVKTAAETLAIADAVGPEICCLKTHVDVMADFTPDFVARLQALAERHNFLLFEDRKFADIGNTVAMQYAGGLYKIAEWSHITNAHPVPGPGIVDGLQAAAGGRGRGLLLLAEMSSKGTLAQGAYAEATVKMAEAHPEFVIGYICQRRLSAAPSMVHMTPGVNLADAGDALGQQYNTPEAVCARGTDVIIVGRGIIAAPDPAAAAAKYRKAGWDAYQATVVV